MVSATKKERADRLRLRIGIVFSVEHVYKKKKKRSGTFSINTTATNTKLLLLLVLLLLLQMLLLLQESILLLTGKQVKSVTKPASEMLTPSQQSWRQALPG